MSLTQEKINEYFKLFDKGIDRRNTDCIKWDNNMGNYGREDVCPISIADTDFEVPEKVKQTLVSRAMHGAYGYTKYGEEYAEASANWLRKRHGVEASKEWISFSPGVIDSLNNAVAAFSKPGDKIAIFTPIYPPFYSVIEYNKCEVFKCPLIRTENSWEINFELLEEGFKQGVSMLLLCSPHNPVGRVWRMDELENIRTLAKKYHAMVVCDEIHSDMVFPGNKHIPWIKVDPDGISLFSATKAFNIAGLRSSSVAIPNEDVRNKFKEAFAARRIDGLNMFGLLSQKTCYEVGDEWLDALCLYVDGNRQFFEEYMRANRPEFGITRSQGTYLEWIDLSALGLDNEETFKWCINNGVGVTNGISFGDPEGVCHIRINLATQRRVLEEGLEKLCAKGK